MKRSVLVVHSRTTLSSPRAALKSALMRGMRGGARDTRGCRRCCGVWEGAGGVAGFGRVQEVLRGLGGGPDALDVIFFGSFGRVRFVIKYKYLMKNTCKLIKQQQRQPAAARWGSAREVDTNAPGARGCVFFDHDGWEDYNKGDITECIEDERRSKRRRLRMWVCGHQRAEARGCMLGSTRTRT